MMIRYRFYVGTFDKDGVLVPHTGVQDYLAATFGGYSAYTVAGVWRDDEGLITSERSIIYEVLVAQPRAPWIPVQDHALALRNLARQQTVLYTREQVEGGFVP